MRYLRQEQIVTTVCNKEVSDINIIKKILYTLQKERIDFSLSINRYFESDYSHHTMYYNKVRVTNVNDKNVDFLVLDKNSMISLKEIPFDLIIQIHALAKKNHILDYSENIDRWQLIDIED